jgi:malonyl-CoA/methylmalonyl-CoA synthetase
MGSENFGTAILRASVEFANLPALIKPDNNFRFSYADLAARSEKYAAALRKLGACSGDRVAVQVDKSVEALCLYVGCLRAGAVFLPLNTAYTVHEMAYFLNDARPRVVVCRPQDAEEISKVGRLAGISARETLGSNGSGSLIGIVDEQMSGAPDEPRAADDVAALIYTSGTTGRSKGAMVTHGNLASNAYALKSAWKFTAQDVLLHALPMFHIHGLFVAANVSLLSGSSILFLEGFDVNEIVGLLPSATVMMGVPMFYTRLLQHPSLNGQVCTGVRLFVSGSAPLLPETHREWTRRTGHEIVERYGMTETGINTSNPLSGQRLPGSVGLPLPGVQIRTTSTETGEPLPPEQIGMLEVKGPNVFKGYWHMPGKTADSFTADRFFKTGDLGVIGEGGYVSIVGRDKDLIISGGYNIYPREIEIELDALDGVVESAVIGVPHLDLGECVVAIVARAVGSQLTEKEILQKVSGRLARFKLPRRIVFEQELPRNAMGKVQKNELRKRNVELFSHSHRPPSS